MIFAVMDLGSNSFKLTVAHYFRSRPQDSGRFQVLHKERHPVQLGASVFEKKHEISARHFKAGLEALASMKQSINNFDFPLVRVVGTSAIREAKNGERFVCEAHKKLGIFIEVITGEEEARLIAQGLARALPEVTRGLLVDIGGGSTELASFGPGWKEPWRHSFKMGSVRLSNDLPPVRGPKDLLFFRNKLDAALRKAPPPAFKKLVGSAGSIQSLGALLSAKRKRPVIQLQDLDDWIVANMNAQPKQLVLRYGLEPARARVVFGGAIILSQTLHFLKAPSIEVTEMTLRDGVLVDFIEKLKSHHWVL